MTKIAFSLTLFVTGLVCGLPAAPAQAQATRAFVSATGSDSNSCINVASPCRHFQAAYNAMPNGGEIDVLDPANYGALTATHTLSVVGRGWATLSPVAGAAAMTINSGASDAINISGVAFDGAGLAGTTGIAFGSGASLTVQDSVFRNFTTDGINFFPNASGELFISGTLLSNNAEGIVINPGHSAIADVTLDHVAMVSNTSNGLHFNINTAQVHSTVSNSVSVHNGTGILLDGSLGISYLAVRSSNISSNGTGIEISSPVVTVRLSQCIITENSTGWVNNDSGFSTLLSTSDNLIDDNASGNGTPSGIAYK